MKIVLNKCIGAFDLSPIAIKELYSLKGWKVFFYIMSKNTILIKTTVDVAQSLNGVGIYILTKDYGPMVSFCEIKRGYLFDINSIRRDDKDLIYVVNKYGDKAYPSTTTLLQIVDIPLTKVVTIQSNHGFEIAVEKFDSLMK